MVFIAATSGLTGWSRSPGIPSGGEILLGCSQDGTLSLEKRFAVQLSLKRLIDNMIMLMMAESNGGTPVSNWLWPRREAGIFGLQLLVLLCHKFNLRLTQLQ